jgi:murein tripeptide amidase MpaA
MEISQDFDAGNIEVVSCAEPGNIQLRIREDYRSEFYQWFYFKLSGVQQTDCHLQILNAAGAAYPRGFENYRVLYSYDQEQWLRHPTELQGGVLSFDFEALHDSVYFAYFVPFSMERHQRLIATSEQSPQCTHRLLGQTLDGQDLDLLKIARTDIAQPGKICWIIARQHPGESMAEWWMEGCIERLLDAQNPSSQALLEKCTVFLVPNMNPDGSRRGHLRTNAVGRNLNREWAEPTMQASPEVFLVKQAIQETGADFFLDVHGDESLPYCFIAGTEGLADWDQEKQQQLDFYRNTLAASNPDFQTARGYPPKQPGQANLTMSTVQIADLHHCLAMTLEMPFKDTTATPDEMYGWSVARSKSLAHSCLDTLDSYLETL